MRFRGVPIELTLEGGKLTVGAQDDGFESIRVGVGDEVREIKAGESHTFDL